MGGHNGKAAGGRAGHVWEVKIAQEGRKAGRRKGEGVIVWVTD